MNAGRKLWEVYVVQVNPNLEHPLVAKTFKAEVVHELLDQCAASGGLAVAFEYLKLPVVTAGCGYPGSLANAPNENMRLDLYLKHAQHVARLIKEFGND